MRVKVLGKVWSFERRALTKDDGHCDPPSQAGKRIIVDSRLHGERELDVILHELLHAADWSKDEEWVDSLASDLARILTRLGYRRN